MSTTSESAGTSPADTQMRATLTGATHTEDDWDTMKADIKALRSVSPQPEPAKSMDDKVSTLGRARIRKFRNLTQSNEAHSLQRSWRLCGRDPANSPQSQIPRRNTPIDIR